MTTANRSGRGRRRAPEAKGERLRRVVVKLSGQAQAFRRAHRGGTPLIIAQGGRDRRRTSSQDAARKIGVVTPISSAQPVNALARNCPGTWAMPL